MLHLDTEIFSHVLCLKKVFKVAMMTYWEWFPGEASKKAVGGSSLPGSVGLSCIKGAEAVQGEASW